MKSDLWVVLDDNDQPIASVRSGPYTRCTMLGLCVAAAFNAVPDFNPDKALARPKLSLLNGRPC